MFKSNMKYAFNAIHPTYLHYDMAQQISCTPTQWGKIPPNVAWPITSDDSPEWLACNDHCHRCV